MISEITTMPFKVISILHNKKPKEDIRKLKHGEIEQMKNSRLDQLIELIKMKSTNKQHPNYNSPTPLKQTISITNLRNYMVMSKTNSKKQLTGEDHTMQIDTVNSDRALNIFNFLCECILIIELCI